jgi:selenium metabolism protein YedF
VDKGTTRLITVLVDNQAASENVSRFLTTCGFAVDIEMGGSEYTITGSRLGSSSDKTIVPEQATDAETKIVILVATDRLGRGDDELGKKLMANFLATLKEMGSNLWRLILLNGGVKLSVEGSDVLNSLAELEKESVRIMVCGTCLTHFGLIEKKKVGETTNMLDIVTSMQLADRVISMT